MSDQFKLNEAADVSDTTFAREMWRHNERGNVEAAKEVRDLWKYGKESEGYGSRTGALSAHEIGALKEKYLQEAGGDAEGFARAVERAALIKAYTLLPELRQAEHAKHHRRYFRDGLNYGLAIYCGAIRALAMGEMRAEVDPDIPAKPVKPRTSSEITKLEKAACAETARSAFESWAGQRQFDLRRQDGDYTNIVTAYAWMGWIGRAQDASEAQKHDGGPNA